MALRAQLLGSVTAEQGAGAQVSAPISVHTPSSHEKAQLPTPKPGAQVPEVPPLFVRLTSQLPFSVPAAQEVGSSQFVPVHPAVQVHV